MSFLGNFARKASRLVLFCVCWLWMPFTALAQGYTVSGESSLTGNFTLTIYDGDSTTHTLTYKANKGMFLFTGQVESPVLASLEHPSMKKPLYFYLENSEIAISLNATHPEQSVVKNSRSNSEYRYLVERYTHADDPASFLRQYVKETPEGIYLPFMLYQQMGKVEDGLMRQMITLMQGRARHTYHYTLLRRWMKETPAVSEGSEMPEFSYLNDKKERCSFAQTRSQEGSTLVFFSATWCDICHTQLQQAQKALADKNAQILVINIDDNPNGWDAHYLKELSVDHIPYMILVDKQGVVTARDIRAWELPKLRIDK